MSKGNSRRKRGADREKATRRLKNPTCDNELGDDQSSERFRTDTHHQPRKEERYSHQDHDTFERDARQRKGSSPRHGDRSNSRMRNHHSPRRHSYSSHYEDHGDRRISRGSNGTHWRGDYTIRHAHGFGRGARRSRRDEGHEFRDAPHGVGRIGKPPIRVPAAMASAMMSTQRVRRNGTVVPDFWSQVAGIETAIEDLETSSRRALAVHDRHGIEERDFKEAVKRCERKMMELRRWKYIYIRNHGLRHQTAMLKLGNRLNDVIKDNVYGCVSRAKTRFLDEEESQLGRRRL